MAVGALAASDSDGVVGTCVYRTPVGTEHDLDSIVGADIGLRGDRERGVALRREGAAPESAMVVCRVRI